MTLSVVERVETKNAFELKFAWERESKKSQ